MNKNPIIAFLLAFFPGGGLMYLGKALRGLFYTATIFGLPIIAIAFVTVTGIPFFFIFGLIGLLLYVVNFVDTAVTASKLYNRPELMKDGAMQQKNPDMERFFTIVLSFVPGLGHFQLGLVYRGMTLLAAFLGLAVMVLFVSFMTNRSEFLIFLASLPIIWVYGFFDVMQLLERKQKGEELTDRSVLEEFENRSGRKSKAIATLLSIVPGVGHLYLGLQKRGLQLMVAFLFSIYILDILRLGIFLFIIPIIWFYSFFDGLQQASRADEETLEDEPIFSSLMNYQKWLGLGLILLGLYYLGANIIVPIAGPILQEMFHIEIYDWYFRYIQVGVICLLLIGGGMKLMIGKKLPNKEKEGESK